MKELTKEDLDYLCSNFETADLYEAIPRSLFDCRDEAYQLSIWAAQLINEEIQASAVNVFEASDRLGDRLDDEIEQLERLRGLVRKLHNLFPERFYDE